MKLISLLFFLLVLNVAAQTLQEILQIQKHDNKTKSALAYRDAKAMQNAQQNSYSAPWISGGIAYSKEGEKKGEEFNFSFSQELVNPFDMQKKESLQKSLESSLEQQSDYGISQRELDISQKYYIACISKLTLKQSKELQKKQLQKIKELKNAFDLGEISKKELLFSKLDFASLSREVNNYKRVYMQELAALEQSLSDVDIQELSCRDLVPPQRHHRLEKKRQHRMLQSLEYEKEATLKSHQLYDSIIPKMQYQLLYEKELSMERITLGISIPLTQLTQQQELLKTQKLKTNTALSYELEALRDEIQRSHKQQEQLLEVLYDDYSAIKDEILPLSRELLELAEYAYKEGEGSLMEYLDAWRSYEQNSLELLDTKKSYYHALFELHKLTDSKYGAIK